MDNQSTQAEQTEVQVKAPEKNKRHSVDSEVLQSVLNYLNNRPYGEVAQLIQGILQTATPHDQE